MCGACGHLTADERQRAERYVFEKDRTTFCGGARAAQSAAGPLPEHRIRSICALPTALMANPRSPLTRGGVAPAFQRLPLPRPGAVCHDPRS